MSKQQVFKIKVLLWDKDSPYDFGQSGDKGKFFLKIPHNFFNSVYFHNLSGGQFKVLLELLRRTSECNRNDIEIHRNNIRMTLKCNRTDIEMTLNILRDLKAIDFIEENFANKEVNKEINKINKKPEVLQLPKKKISNNKPKKISFKKQIEDLYENYPRKIGKKKGVETLSRLIKDEDQLKSLSIAIKNYEISVSGSEPQFIKHFSSFANCWEDYLEINVEEKPTEESVLALFDEAVRMGREMEKNNEH